MKNKLAFTLAEVLITLVIIGVVAALTIPTAINKYREQELKSQFRKTYSVITQAIHKTEMNDFFGYARCYYPTNYSDTQSGDCPAFWGSIFKNLSVAKFCHGNALSDGCIPNYKPYTINPGCTGFSHGGISNRDVYVLSDGQVFIFMPTFPVLMLDINGHKGPNTFGKDLFVLFVQKNNSSNMFIGSRGNTCEATDLDSDARTAEQMIQYALLGKNN